MDSLKRWPPLNCLRGFATAARLRSFSAAARELHLTQSAISHQIKTLESWLELDLFIRDKRKVTLTDAGLALLQTAEDCLDVLDRGLQRVEQYRKPNQLIVHTSSAFASRWLVPRLGDFRRLHAESDVWMYTTDAEPDLDLAEVHYAILHGDGHWPDIECQSLLQDALIPVCAPTHPLMSRAGREAADLLEYDLLHGEDEVTWGHWFEHAGLDTRPVSGPNFSNPAHLLQSAELGQGIGLCQLTLAADALQSGRLACPLPLALESRQGYFLAWRRDGLKSERMQGFREWLENEAREFIEAVYLPWMNLSVG